MNDIFRHVNPACMDVNVCVCVLIYACMHVLEITLNDIFRYVDPAFMDVCVCVCVSIYALMCARMHACTFRRNHLQTMSNVHACFVNVGT